MYCHMTVALPHFLHVLFPLRLVDISQNPLPFFSFMSTWIYCLALSWCATNQSSCIYQLMKTISIVHIFTVYRPISQNRSMLAALHTCCVGLGWGFCRSLNTGSGGFSDFLSDGGTLFPLCAILSSLGVKVCA